MIRYTIQKHATAFPSKVLARTGGAHIYNVKLTQDHDNGTFVGKGTWLGLDLYEEAAPTAVNAIVREQAPNGEYYVEIVSTDNAYFVYQVPMIEEEYNNSFKLEENYFNAEEEVVRCYELKPGDIVAISDAGFASTPTVGATVTLNGVQLG